MKKNKTAWKIGTRRERRKNYHERSREIIVDYHSASTRLHFFLIRSLVLAKFGDYSSILIRFRPRRVDFDRSVFFSIRRRFASISLAFPRPARLRRGPLASPRSSLVPGSSSDLKQKSISHLRRKIESSRVYLSNIFSHKKIFEKMPRIFLENKNCKNFQISKQNYPYF